MTHKLFRVDNNEALGMSFQGFEMRCFCGEPPETRTLNQLIKSQLLYQLS
jgi:hypothetical protein